MGPGWEWLLRGVREECKRSWCSVQTERVLCGNAPISGGYLLLGDALGLVLVDPLGFVLVNALGVVLVVGKSDS